MLKKPHVENELSAGLPGKLGNLDFSGNLVVFEECQGKFHENGKNQGKVREFWSCGMNIVGTSFKTISILFSQNRFYCSLCLIYFIAKH